VYRTSILKTKQEDAQINEKIERLLRQEQDFSDHLAALKEERERVSAERDRLEKTLEAEKRKAGSNEAGLFDEIVGLDEQLTRNLHLQEQQQAEIKSLSNKIKGFEKEIKTLAPKVREVDMLAKRFGALYKNISVHDRAVEGFAGLTEEMKIRGEEIIHRLNEASDLVPIKRKVFSPKGREAVWEVLFSYNGRLYFRKPQDKRIEVIAVGNKNTQTRDLEFIDRISRKP
jgi:chromosome segregation ATPase